jgi:putative transcriptional regulator
MSSTLDTVRNRVRELRMAHDLSQAQLGAELDVSRQTINSIENGRYLPSLPLAIALARRFDEAVEEIFILDEPTGAT